jgi:hypothetical protein
LPREQAGEQDRRLQLGARDGKLVADRVQRRALDRHRRAAVGRFDLRAHLTQRLVGADGAARERLVASQFETVPVLAGEDPAEQAQDGAGVAAVDRAGRFDEAAKTAAGDADGGLVRLGDTGSEGANGLERGVGVGGVAEVPQLAFAFCDRCEERAALADALDGRDGDVADERRRGLDAGHCSPSTGVMTTP